MKSNDFRLEIENYSLDDLELILNTQQELYTPDEIALIEARVTELHEVETGRIIEHLPYETARKMKRIIITSFISILIIIVLSC